MKIFYTVWLCFAILFFVFIPQNMLNEKEKIALHPLLLLD